MLTYHSNVENWQTNYIKLVQKIILKICLLGSNLIFFQFSIYKTYILWIYFHKTNSDTNDSFFGWEKKLINSVKMEKRSTTSRTVLSRCIFLHQEQSENSESEIRWCKKIRDFIRIGTTDQENIWFFVPERTNKIGRFCEKSLCFAFISVDIFVDSDAIFILAD